MMRIRPAGIDIEFFKVKTDEGIEMDAWMVKPLNFDPTKKYPIVFTVYGEPAGSTVKDTYGTGRNRLYAEVWRRMVTYMLRWTIAAHLLQKEVHGASRFIKKSGRLT